MMFVEHQEQRDHEIIEDVLYLIDEEDCQIADYVEVPKVCAHKRSLGHTKSSHSRANDK